MNWKIKSLIQNGIALLPSCISYKVYFSVQQKFGGWQKIDYLYYSKAAKDIVKHILQVGGKLNDKTIFEIGTGRIVLIPIFYWLIGAKKIVTVDLNPYLVEDLVIKSAKYLIDNEKQVIEYFDGLILNERWKNFKDFINNKNEITLKSLLAFCNIEYLAPCDASNTNLPDNSVDYHTSYTVLEHIPKNMLIKIFNEGNRIIKDGGLFIHEVDYGDHFAYTDNSISLINFLKFSDFIWALYAGNKYMYMNRMRHDDFISFYNEINHKILLNDPNFVEELFELLETKQIVVSKRFMMKSNKMLAIHGAGFVTASPK